MTSLSLTSVSEDLVSPLFFSENSLDVLKSLDMLSDYPATLATLNDVPDDITYDNLALKVGVGDFLLVHTCNDTGTAVFTTLILFFISGKVGRLQTIK